MREPLKNTEQINYPRACIYFLLIKHHGASLGPKNHEKIYWLVERNSSSGSTRSWTRVCKSKYKGVTVADWRVGGRHYYFCTARGWMGSSSSHHASIFGGWRERGRREPSRVAPPPLRYLFGFFKLSKFPLCMGARARAKNRRAFFLLF